MIRLNLLHPAIANPWVRQAMSLAVPRQHLVDAFCAGNGVVGSQVLNPLSLGYNKNLPQIQYSIEKAKEAMTKAGYNYDWLKPPPETPISAYLIPAIGGLVGGFIIGAALMSFVKRRK
jgi:ABC-type transport system substrate-binding protein